MIRIIFTYGLISGVVIILSITGTTFTVGDYGGASLWLGYLIMLVALSSILVGVRQHRDQTLGGVIKFRTALMVGLGIALVASLAYVLIWEVYLAATHYSYMDKYAAAGLAAKRAAGVTGAAYAKAVADAETMRRQYANPLYRLPETFLEIFPVGLLIALASAALLRNPRFLPAKVRSVAA
jgi:polyferredoxin